jgi:hypothetical protein
VTWIGAFGVVGPTSARASGAGRWGPLEKAEEDVRRRRRWPRFHSGSFWKRRAGAREGGRGRWRGKEVGRGRKERGDGGGGGSFEIRAEKIECSALYLGRVVLRPKKMG